MLEEQFTSSRHRAPESIVFCHPALGTPLDPSKLMRYARKALDLAGVDKSFRVWHGLRHTSLTETAASGVPAMFVQAKGGSRFLGELDHPDGDAWLSFGGQRLRLDPATVKSKPGLDAYDGRQVVVGIRPEDMEDAAVLRETDPDRRLSVICDIREDMGSEVYVHSNVAAQPVATQEVDEALVVDDAEDEETRIAAERARGGGVRFVARLERTTSAREREPLELEVDVTRLHFFDPESGLRVDSA